MIIIYQRSHNLSQQDIVSISQTFAVNSEWTPGTHSLFQISHFRYEKMRRGCSKDLSF